MNLKSKVSVSGTHVGDIFDILFDSMCIIVLVITKMKSCLMRFSRDYIGQIAALLASKNQMFDPLNLIITIYVGLVCRNYICAVRSHTLGINSVFDLRL